MQVELRLIALESNTAPKLNDHQSHSLELPKGLSIAALLERLSLPSGGYGVLLNDRAVSVGERSAALREGDRVTLFPAIKGGW